MPAACSAALVDPADSQKTMQVLAQGYDEVVLDWGLHPEPVMLLHCTTAYWKAPVTRPLVPECELAGSQLASESCVAKVKKKAISTTQWEE